MKLLGLALMILVLGAGGGAYFNYQRNAPMDTELAFRPYKGLSDADLDALIEAYRTNITSLTQQLGSGPDDSGFQRVRPGDFSGKLEAFERFQEENERWKAGHRQTVEGKVVVDALLQEKSIRDRGLHKESVRIMRRVTTL
jgi:hypothetical protein